MSGFLIFILYVIPITAAVVLGFIFLHIYLTKRQYKRWREKPELVTTMVRLRKTVYGGNVWVARSWQLKDGRVFYPVTNGMYGCEGGSFISVQELISLLKADNPGVYDLGKIQMAKSAQAVQSLIVFHKYESPYTFGLEHEVAEFLTKKRL